MRSLWFTLLGLSTALGCNQSTAAQGDGETPPCFFVPTTTPSATAPPVATALPTATVVLTTTPPVATTPPPPATTPTPAMTMTEPPLPSCGEGGNADVNRNDYPDQVDVLFVVDNSPGMAPKQKFLEEAAADLVSLLARGPCFGPGGMILLLEEDGTCPGGGPAVLPPIDDIHFGVISSSLGDHGLAPDQDADDPVCSGSAEMNDKAHLIATRRDGLLEDAPRGYLAWDPTRAHCDDIESDETGLVRKLQAQIRAVGTNGCGFEAPLEAAYRFLSDPQPHLSLARFPCHPDDTKYECVTPHGVDNELLRQRQNFLRPLSYVIVVLLTDENDCSVRDEMQAYYTLKRTPMPRGTRFCEADPNHECCQSCAAAPNEGCPTDPSDRGCEQPFADVDASGSDREAYGLRCFDQKRRFGIDFLHSPTRYGAGFTNPDLKGSDGRRLPNGLFEAGRNRNHVRLTAIVGTPWQNVVRGSGEETGALRGYSELDWELFVPDPETGTGPLGAYNVESVAPREGVNQLTSNAPVTPRINPVNGHDRAMMLGDGVPDDLQYACITELPEPRDCTLEDDASDCPCVAPPARMTVPLVDASASLPSDAGTTSSLPSDAGTTSSQSSDAGSPMTPNDGGILDPDFFHNDPRCLNAEGAHDEHLRYTQAYPGTRIMEVIRLLDVRGVLASACPKEPHDTSSLAYGYRPAMRALIESLLQPPVTDTQKLR